MLGCWVGFYPGQEWVINPLPMTCPTDLTPAKCYDFSLSNLSAYLITSYLSASLIFLLNKSPHRTTFCFMFALLALLS